MQKEPPEEEVVDKIRNMDEADDGEESDKKHRHAFRR